MLLFLNLYFFLAIIHSSTVQCLENVRDDSSLLFNGSVINFETNITQNGPKRSVKDFTDAFDWQGLWTALSLTANATCKNHVDIVWEQMENLSFWALKMMDASAKLPSGILRGNLNQFGDFDECLATKGYVNNQIIKAKYCLANIQIKISANEPNEKIKLLDGYLHSHRMLTNELKDKGHRIPRFETFNWGICIPELCSRIEIEEAFNAHLQNISRKSQFNFKASLSDDVCYVDKKIELSIARIGVIFLFSTIFGLIVLGTFLDTKKYILKDLKWTRVLYCFSLKRNWSLLLKTDSVADDLKCLHGARFLNAIALLLSHKQIAMLFTPVPNRTEMSEAFSKPWTMIGRSAILYTDSFILISGLLASYSIVKELDDKKKINFKNKLINRFIRFTPNLLCIILFCTFIMDSMNSGPQWGLVVNKYSNLCKKYMWRNLLYIHNHFGFENMCLTHTHQLGIDMQLFLISPVFIYLLWKSPKIGSLIIVIASTASTWLRYVITDREELSTLLYFGISVERLWKTANLSYILPTHRLTVYLMGILMGYYLRRGGKTLNFNQWETTAGWILSILAGLFAIFGPYEASYKNYTYQANVASYFNAFAPILWTAFILWAILACVNNCGGIFNDFLSWKYFIIFTRISYAVYLTQFPVFFYNVGIERTVQYYKGLFSLFDLLEYFTIFIASVAMTLMIDLPFQELKKVLTVNYDKTKRVCEKNQDHPLGESSQVLEKARKRRLQPFGT